MQSRNGPRSLERMKILSIKWILVAADNMSAVNHTIQFDVKAVDNGMGTVDVLNHTLHSVFCSLCLCQIPFSVVPKMPCSSVRLVRWQERVRWRAFDYGMVWGGRVWVKYETQSSLLHNVHLQPPFSFISTCHSMSWATRHSLLSSVHFIYSPK